MIAQPRKERLVQCSGWLVRGNFKGERCKNEKRQPVDRNNNTRQWFCASHAGQRGKKRPQ